MFQLADQLVLEVYRITAGFPKPEIFGLTGRTRRAVASKPMDLLKAQPPGR